MPTRQRSITSMLGMNKAAARARAGNIARRLKREWGMLVKAELRTTMSMYRAGMSVKVVRGAAGRLMVRMDVQGKIPVSVERGLGPGGVGTYGPQWDMRKTLLRSPKARMSKAGGRYLVVPFQHSTKAIQQLGGKQAYAAARRLAPTVTHERRTMAWGERLPPGVHSGKLKPHHVTDPLAGLYRMRHATGGKSWYTTFRTASDAGQPWMTKGIRPRRFIKRTLEQHLSRILREVG
jgi:hypothetical protein